MDTETEQNLPTAKPRKHKITAIDVDEIAKHVSKHQTTEAEACHHLNIPPQQWYNWKSKAKRTPRFESICARIRAGSIIGAMDRIEKAGEDFVFTDDKGRTQVRRGDWRADHARLALIAPERFGQQAGQGNTTVNVLLSEASMKAIEDRLVQQRQGKAVVDCPTVKQVGNCTELDK